jgi:PadR family transcriptional regulator PadR
VRGTEVRLSRTALEVLRFLLTSAAAAHSGADIAKHTRASSGTLYPLLARLESAGWATSEWEAVEPAKVGRPRRRFYKLTALGRTKARQALAPLQIASEVGGLAWNA